MYRKTSRAVRTIGTCARKQTVAHGELNPAQDGDAQREQQNLLRPLRQASNSPLATAVALICKIASSLTNITGWC
jgi:hypothetical protein